MSNPRSEPKIYATLDSLCSKVGMLLAGRHQTVMCSLALTASMPAGVEQQWAPQRILTAALHRVSHLCCAGLQPTAVED